MRSNMYKSSVLKWVSWQTSRVNILLLRLPILILCAYLQIKDTHRDYDCGDHYMDSIGKCLSQPGWCHCEDICNLVGNGNIQLLFIQRPSVTWQLPLYSDPDVSMMTSSNGNIEFPAQRPVTRSFDVFFDLYLNKRWSKQWCGWWFETPSGPVWRHRITHLLCEPPYQRVQRHILISWSGVYKCMCPHNNYVVIAIKKDIHRLHGHSITHAIPSLCWSCSC